MGGDGMKEMLQAAAIAVGFYAFVVFVFSVGGPN
jgi:hypothetical protein